MKNAFSLPGKIAFIYLILFEQRQGPAKPKFWTTLILWRLLPAEHRYSCNILRWASPDRSRDFRCNPKVLEHILHNFSFLLSVSLMDLLLCITHELRKQCRNPKVWPSSCTTSFMRRFWKRARAPVVAIGIGMRQQSLKVHGCYAPSNDCMAEAEVIIPKVCVKIT